MYVLLVQRLQEDRISLTQRQNSFRQLLEEINQKYEALKTKLQDNETHAQVRVFYTFFSKTSISRRVCVCVSQYIH